MHHEDANVVSMIRAGAKGYMLKDANTQELHRALRSVIETGSYYSEFVAGKLVNSVKNGSPEPAGKIILSDRETQFLQLVCTELTYKEIAEQMYLSTRTIEGYRDSLFMRLNCKNRIGLVLYAIKEGLYDVTGRER
jgi:DNA-binding NarL/FixJ family response regulator